MEVTVKVSSTLKKAIFAEFPRAVPIFTAPKRFFRFVPNWFPKVSFPVRIEWASLVLPISIHKKGEMDKSEATVRKI
jgi:hypothetical protein